jgi:hypothetical protein
MISEEVKRIFNNENCADTEELSKSQLGLTKLVKIRLEKIELKKTLTDQLEKIVKIIDNLDQQIDQRLINNCTLSNKIKFKNNITSKYA